MLTDCLAPTDKQVSACPQVCKGVRCWKSYLRVCKKTRTYSTFEATYTEKVKKGSLHLVSFQFSLASTRNILLKAFSFLFSSSLRKLKPTLVNVFSFFFIQTYENFTKLNWETVLVFHQRFTNGCYLIKRSFTQKKFEFSWRVCPWQIHKGKWWAF